MAYALIRERMNDKPRGIMGAIGNAFNKTAILEIRIPKYDYLRAQVFVEDLKELADEYIDVHDLIKLLYLDFIDQIRQGGDFRELAAGLKDRKILVTKETKSNELKPVTSTHWQLQEQVTVRKVKKKRILVEIPRKDALRGEVFLHDLNESDPSFNILLEELITILLMDLISHVKNGNSKYYIESLLSRLEG